MHNLTVFKLFCASLLDLSDDHLLRNKVTSASQHCPEAENVYVTEPAMCMQITLTYTFITTLIRYSITLNLEGPINSSLKVNILLCRYQ